MTTWSQLRREQYLARRTPPPESRSRPTGKVALRTPLGDAVKATESERIGLELMQAEFESHQLEVQLVPCRHYVNMGGCIRVAVSKNAVWYSKFCAQHASGRVRRKLLFDTRIKRRSVAALLARLVAGLPSRSKYAPELIAIARKVVAAERIAS